MLGQDQENSGSDNERAARLENRNFLKQFQLASRDSRSSLYVLLDVMHADLKKFNDKIIEPASIVLHAVDHNGVPKNVAGLIKDLEDYELANLKVKDDLDKLRKTIS